MSFRSVRSSALHEMAEEAVGGDGFEVPELEEGWKMGCQSSPMWETEGEAWSEDEGVSSSGSREGSVCNYALHVIGLCGLGGKISRFSCRIGSWQRWH